MTDQVTGANNATPAAEPLALRSNDLLGALLPTHKGQPGVLTNAGPEHGIERGHWYSPAFVRQKLEASAKPLLREIKQLEGQKRRLEDMLFAAGRMEQAPCFVCGYNGPGYFQAGQHKCAARHHKLRLRA